MTDRSGSGLWNLNHADIAMRQAILFVCLIIMGGAVLWPALVMIPLDPMPGDVTINQPDLHIYIPLTTCISASVVLTLLFWYLRK